jgi:hypothetical protein
MTILRSRRVVVGTSLIPLRSRIIDMKRGAVQQSKSRREPARRAKDKRESVDRRTHGVREVLQSELGRIETLKSFLLLFLSDEVNSWYPRNESSQPGGQSLAEIYTIRRRMFDSMANLPKRIHFVR